MWLFQRRRRSCLPMLAIAMIALGCTLVPLGPAILVQQVRVSATPAMSLSEIARLGAGERRGPVRVEGRLRGEGLATIPGTSGDQALAGRLLITVSGTRGRNTRVEQEVYRWEEYAESIWVSDGERQVALAINPHDLPLRRVSLDPPSLVMEQDGNHHRPVQVRFDGLELPVDPQPFEGFLRSDTISARADLSVLRADQPVVIVADVEAGPNGAQIVPPQNGSTLITIGSFSESWRAALGSALCLPVGGLLLIGVGLALRRVRPR